MAAEVTLAALLQRVLAEQFGGEYRALGRAIGLDPAHTARLAKGVEQHIKAETALRIALVCDLDPDAVLRAAGKDETIRVIRRLYGKAAPVRAQRTEEQRAWERLLEQLAPAERKALRVIAEGLAGGR